MQEYVVKAFSFPKWMNNHPVRHNRLPALTLSERCLHLSDAASPRAGSWYCCRGAPDTRGDFPIGPRTFLRSGACHCRVNRTHGRFSAGPPNLLVLTEEILATGRVHLQLFGSADCVDSEENAELET